MKHNEKNIDMEHTEENLKPPKSAKSSDSNESALAE
jgi:hypothetical protein